MNTVYKSLFGAASLIAAASVPASAANFTFSLHDLDFVPYYLTTDYDTNTGGASPVGIDNGKASGTITVSYTPEAVVSDITFSSQLNVVAWNITTTAGPAGTGYSVNYDSTSDFGSGSSDDGFSSNLILLDDTNNYTLKLVWGAAELEDAIKGDLTQVTLLDNESYERRSIPVFAGPRDHIDYTRVSGAYDTGTGIGDIVGSSGALTIVRDVPEPASMALLGTGLLGMFFARRRAARAA